MNDAASFPTREPIPGRASPRGGDRVASVAAVPVGRFLLVRVETAEGLTGWGEVGAWGLYDAAAAMVGVIGEHLRGEDPDRIEHHWQYVRRQSHYRGAALMAALSAVDVALWDIKGRRAGLPVWQMLGGRVRDRVRLYRHVMAPTKAGLIDGVARARADGWTAVGHLTPFLDDGRDTPLRAETAPRMAEAEASLARYREAAGPEMDLCVELHRRLSLPEALTFCRLAEAARPMFVEDPVRPDNLDLMAEVARRSPVPVATGERLNTPEEFAMLIERRAAHYLRPSPGLVGGITGAIKVAALAEAHGLQIVPHNPFSPLMTAVCAQIAAAAPNVAILEHSGAEDAAPRAHVLRDPLPVSNGHLAIPDGPGLGVAVSPDAARDWPPEPRAFRTRLGVDGAVVDQ